jgi:hypothetical protein
LSSFLPYSPDGSSAAVIAPWTASPVPLQQPLIPTAVWYIIALPLLWWGGVTFQFIAIAVVFCKGGFLELLARKKLQYRLEKGLDRPSFISHTVLTCMHISEVAVQRILVASEEDLVHPPGRRHAALPAPLTAVDASELFLLIDWMYFKFETASMFQSVRHFEVVRITGLCINLETVIARKDRRHSRSKSHTITASVHDKRSAQLEKAAQKVYIYMTTSLLCYIFQNLYLGIINTSSVKSEFAICGILMHDTQPVSL